MENRRAEQGEGEDTRRGCKGVNIVEILCTHIYVEK
jgi:hypothetical protein